WIDASNSDSTIDPSSSSIANLAPGTYSLIVTEDNGCTASDDFTIVSPAGIDVVITKTDVACNGDDTGTLSVNIVGGTPPYNIDWDGPNGFDSDQQTLTDLFAGAYTV